MSVRTAAVALLVASATVLGHGNVQKLAAQGADVRVLGTEVQLIQHNDVDLRGELLALQGESLWILDADERFLEVPIVDIRQVRMQRHRLSTGRIWRWTLVAGGITSAAMFGACTSYGESGAGCGLFALAWGAAWAGVGALSALIIPSTRSFQPSDREALRPYARFPQGLPEGYPARGETVESSSRIGQEDS